LFAAGVKVITAAARAIACGAGKRRCYPAASISVTLAKPAVRMVASNDARSLEGMPSPPFDDLPRMPARPREASKRDFGRVVVVGGSVGMAGAPALTAMAALRSGAGLVELLVPEPVVAIAAGFDPCVMTWGFPAAEGGFSSGASDALATRLARASAVAIGPGVGRSDAVCECVATLWRHLDRPAVFDADALWALSQCGPLAEHAGPRLLTPHAGEMLRLLGRDPAGPEAGDRPFLEAEARRMAADVGAVILLKGAGTLVTDGRREARNTTGNPGMATAGTGDVLTGVSAALLAQGMSPFDAARLAAWVHGRAGDAAAADLGQVSMTARDLLDRLHVAFREVVQ
jgi:NAD(P)H-hydrate epimerase